MIAWTVFAVALCLALGVIGVGYLVGFGNVTFKLYQLTDPCSAAWLAIGLAPSSCRRRCRRNSRLAVRILGFTSSPQWCSCCSTR